MDNTRLLDNNHSHSEYNPYEDTAGYSAPPTTQLQLQDEEMATGYNSPTAPYLSPSTQPNPYSPPPKTSPTSPYDNSHPVKDKDGQQQSPLPPTYADYQTNSTYRSNDRTLPDNWESYRDPNTGNYYYCNMSTMETTWTHPGTGAVADTNAPAYSVPDYYTNIAEKQTAMQNETFQPYRPSIDPEKQSTVPYDASSKYSPYYYTEIIKKTVDPNILNQAQLDSVPPRHMDSAKYSTDLSCHQRVCGTMGKNPYLTALSIVLWVGMAVTAVTFFTRVDYGDRPDERYINFIWAGIPYSVYFCCFIGPAGVIPLLWMCGVGCSPCLSDRMIETLYTPASEDTKTLIRGIDAKARASPSLTLHVECWHWKTVHYTERERQNDGSYKTVHKTRQEKVVTFRGYRKIPIIRWKDLSPSGLVVADIVNQCPANMVSIAYNHIYTTHSKQSGLIELLRSQYYYCHCYRDDHCAVTLSYDISIAKTKVDVVVKDRNCSYWSSHIFCFNPIMFFLWMYAGLLLPVAMLFRTFVRPVPFTNVKYLHLDNPDPKRDVVTLDRPRFRLRWSWY